MQLKQTSHRKRTVLLLTAIGVLCLGAGLAYALATGGFTSPQSDDAQVDYKTPTDQQIKGGEAIEQQSAESSNNGADPNQVGSDRGVGSSPTTDDGKTGVNVTISAANQNDGVLQIRTLISSIINTGTCTLTLTKGSAVVTRSAGVQAIASSATCKGFDIPVSQLSPGAWQASVTFENDTAKGTGTRTVTVLE